MNLDYRPLALVKQAAVSLQNNDTARLDAELLMANILQCKRMELPLKTAPLSVLEATKFAGFIERRQTGEPVAYILGTQEFWSLEFKVTPDTLVPRPDTETLVEAVLNVLKKTETGTILDLGTGSGCILLSLLSELDEFLGVGVDQSAAALEVAAYNAMKLGMKDRSGFVKSDWFSDVSKSEGGFTAIVSNPPYIPSGDISELMQDVRDFEPMSALDGGSDGLNPYHVIVSTAPEYLCDGGILAVELGIHQAHDVAAIFQNNGFEDVQIFKDLAGVERIVMGKKV